MISAFYFCFTSIHKLFKMKTKIYAFSTGSRKTDMHLTTMGQNILAGQFYFNQLNYKIKLAKILKHSGNLIYNTCTFFR